MNTRKFRGRNWGTWYSWHVDLKKHSNVHVDCSLLQAPAYKNNVPQLLPRKFHVNEFFFCSKGGCPCHSHEIFFSFPVFLFSFSVGESRWVVSMWSAQDQDMVGANIDKFSSFIVHHSYRSKLQCMCQGGTPATPQGMPASRCGSQQWDRPLYSVEEEVRSAVCVCVCVWSAHFDGWRCVLNSRPK